MRTPVAQSVTSLSRALGQPLALGSAQRTLYLDACAVAISCSRTCRIASSSSRRFRCASVRARSAPPAIVTTVIPCATMPTRAARPNVTPGQIGAGAGVATLAASACTYALASSFVRVSCHPGTWPARHGRARRRLPSSRAGRAGFGHQTCSDAQTAVAVSRSQGDATDARHGGGGQDRRNAVAEDSWCDAHPCRHQRGRLRLSHPDRRPAARGGARRKPVRRGRE